MGLFAKAGSANAAGQSSRMSRAKTGCLPDTGSVVSHGGMFDAVRVWEFN
jgi:hypothetical protein